MAGPSLEPSASKAIRRRRISVKRTYVCKHIGCPKSFSKLYNLKAHARLHNGNTPFSCPREDCERVFKWRSSLSSHATWHQRKDAGEIVREYSSKSSLMRKLSSTTSNRSEKPKSSHPGSSDNEPAACERNSPIRVQEVEVPRRCALSKQSSSSPLSCASPSEVRSDCPVFSKNTQFADEQSVCSDQTYMSSDMWCAPVAISSEASTEGRCASGVDSYARRDTPGSTEVAELPILVLSGYEAACEAVSLLNNDVDSVGTGSPYVSPRVPVRTLGYPSSPVSDVNCLCLDSAAAQEFVLPAPPLSHECEYESDFGGARYKPTERGFDAPLLF
jgi:Zinc finger, C2H2 type